ncbi:MAG: MBL fold metallo-hydrolase [Sandaracinaceae bacterium]|nr:MBL fold metallo-hydrolase [Sandaracinaceae bacterium]
MTGRRVRVAAISVLVIAAGCGDGEGAGDAASARDASRETEDAPGLDAPGIDATTPSDDAPGLDAPASDARAALDAPRASDDAGAGSDAGPTPTTILEPAPGEVTILQIDLPVGLVPQLGEAAILVGPDGTMVLMDVGNSGHDDDVRAIVEELNTRWITPARGFPRARGRREVDWIVVSHFHSDHIGGFQDLLTGGSAVDVTRGVVHRGLVDVGAGVTESDYVAMCDLLTGTLSHLDVRLCAGASAGACSVSAATNPATACDGLFVGELGEPSDDAAHAPSYLDLGGGARMEFLGADGWMSDGTHATALPFGTTDSNEENARSLVTLVKHGSFRYHWGGDLTGSGDPGQPDVESHLATIAGAAYYGPLGMDVIHAHHHVRRTSSNATFVDLTAPMDGRDRNVIGGVNGAYLGSPYAEVLGRWADGARLGEGGIWLTDSATGGASHASLVVAGAAVIVQTTGGGTGYWVQAASDTPTTRGFRTVR